jgi:ferredoxin
MATLHKGAKTAQINDQLITVLPSETVLEAALRSGIDFPSSCRVGGCATCKCRLAAGEVKERTETGYLLSAEEIDAGYILACQSVPKTHVRIEVDLASQGERQARSGTVVGQTWDKRGSPTTSPILRFSSRSPSTIARASSQT